jgi:UDP-N-acetylmuramate dehydrogenase
MVIETGDEMVKAVSWLWQEDMPFLVLGGGSNVLVSDAGVKGVVILNRAREVRFDDQATPPTVWAESGMNFGLIARQAASRGLAGLEWACGIPGTLGGAVVGNAGAHGGDMAGSLMVAEILHHDKEKPSGREQWTVERMAYEYRSSILKRRPREAIVLAARLRLERSTPEAVQLKVEEYTDYRRRTQPPGASMGSMFKNPPGDYAGRLIEAAGMKGLKIGGAEISSLHANFFINTGTATATDIYALILVSQDRVAQQFGVKLELEIELVGEW